VCLQRTAETLPTAKRLATGAVVCEIAVRSMSVTDASFSAYVSKILVVVVERGETRSPSGVPSLFLLTPTNLNVMETFAWPWI
jgi:hypothetical protein